MKFTIKYQSKAFEQIESFLNYMEFYYFDKFNDSWLFGAKEIMTRYNKWLKDFYSEALEKIEKYLQQEVIPKQVISEVNGILIFHASIYIKSYTIRFTCKQDNNNKTIFIEDMNIRT